MKINHLLFKLIAFSISLLLLRAAITGQHGFVFLCWNLFLAGLPYLFVTMYEKSTNGIKKMTWLLLSILFLPNSPYIITDLFHLKKNLIAPIWLDTILILSFAICGLIFFIITTQKLLVVVTEYSSSKFVQLMIKVVLILLCSYGVYLGRYLRFNSWDVFSNPIHLINSMIDSVF